MCTVNRHEDDGPAPFAAGSVPQTIVHYIGGRRGAMTYLGRASGRRYAFDLDDCCKYVPDEDLGLFRVHGEFEVLDGDASHIDPARDRAKAEREQLKEELKRELIGSLPASATPPAPLPGKARRGRKRGTGFGALLDCLMNCSDLRGFYGSVELAYDEIADHANTMPEWSGRVPDRENFPNLRSYGRAERLKHGGCTWRGHPEPWFA